MSEMPDTPDATGAELEPGDSIEQYDDVEERIGIDRPLGVTAFGTTANEQLEGESLDQRLSEEVPDDARDLAEDDLSAEVAAMDVRNEDEAFGPADDPDLA